MPRAEGRFQCGLCKKTLKGVHSFQYHAKNIHSNTPKRPDPDFKCLVCKTKFRSQNELHGHCLKNHSPNNGQAMCEACNQIVYKSRLADHIQGAHCYKGEAVAQQVLAQRIAPANLPAALVPLKPLPQNVINSKSFGPLSRKRGPGAKPKQSRPVQKPHTDAKVLVMQHVLGDHSVVERLADCELCTFEGKYKCSYKIIALFSERMEIPTPSIPHFETQVELQKEPPVEPQKEPQLEAQVRPPLASHVGQQQGEVRKISPKIMMPKTQRPGPKNRGTAGPKHRGSKFTSRMPTGPKPKAPKMAGPKSTGRKSESPAKTDDNTENKTPIEIKREKFDEQVDEKTTSASDAPKKVENEKPAVQPRIKKMLEQMEKKVDISMESKSSADVLKSGVPLSCSQCEHFAWSKARMKQHVETAHGTPKAQGKVVPVPVPVPEKKCPKCSHTTANPAEMTRHIKTVHGVPSLRGENIHSCPHCSHIANTRNNLNKHLKAEHKGNKPAGAAKNSGKKSPSGKVKCPKCPYSAESSLVGRHLEGAHGGVACKECKLVVESREALVKHAKAKHLNSSSNGKEKHYRCPRDDCTFATANESHLKVHLTKAHLGEWACPKCNYKAATGLRLDMHLKANHKSLWEKAQELV